MLLQFRLCSSASRRSMCERKSMPDYQPTTQSKHEKKLNYWMLCEMLFLCEMFEKYRRRIQGETVYTACFKNFFKRYFLNILIELPSQLDMERWLTIVASLFLYFALSSSMNCSIENQIYYDPGKDFDTHCILGCEAGNQLARENNLKIFFIHFRLLLQKRVRFQRGGTKMHRAKSSRIYLLPRRNVRDLWRCNLCKYLFPIPWSTLYVVSI